jgi:hypothetical protein
MSIGYTGTLEQRWSQLRSVLERMGLVGIDATAPPIQPS